MTTRSCGQRWKEVEAALDSGGRRPQRRLRLQEQVVGRMDAGRRRTRQGDGLIVSVKARVNLPLALTDERESPLSNLTKSDGILASLVWIFNKAREEDNQSTYYWAKNW